jgi:hypothetical protein
MDHYPARVEGRQACSAPSQTSSNSPTVIPGRARRLDRTSAACAAQRARASSAACRSPCTVKERTAVRPPTRSGPRATRTSHSPGQRSRSEPAPRVHVMPRARGRCLPKDCVCQCSNSTETVVGTVVGMRSWTAIIDPRRFRCRATVFGSAPEGIRTPNLLIRSQMLYPLSYGRVAIRPGQLYKTATEALEPGGARREIQHSAPTRAHRVPLRQAQRKTLGAVVSPARLLVLASEALP